MDFNFTDEQQMIRDSLSRLVREQYDFDTRRGFVGEAPGWSPAMWAKFAELGLLMAPFSEEMGGLGGGPVDAMVVMEEFGKGLVVEPFVPSVVCGGGFVKRAPDALREAVLPGIMDGTNILAFAWAEPRGRYNPADLETTAKKDGGDYVLSGQKAVVAAAPWASHLVVTARTGGDRRERGGVSAFLVPANADGLTLRSYPTVDDRFAAEVYLENVRVPAGSLLAPEGEALPLVELVIDEAIAATCAEACGAMKVALDQTVEYSRTRKQFGQPIGKFQVLQHRMVDMFMEHEQSVSMTYMATLKLGEPELERKKAASAAKTRIGQSGRIVGQSAVQIHGGMGVTEETQVGHYFKRLTVIDSEFGNVDHHLRRYTELSAREDEMLQAAE